MSASFRSHFRSPPPNRETSPGVQRKASSRIPTKPSSTEHKSRAAQHVSKLEKRTSRNVTPSEKVEDGAKKTIRAITPAAAAQHPSAASRRTSVVPPVQLGSQAPQGGRHNGLPPSTIRTPSLISGSSASTSDSPRSTGLRRKPSTIDRYAAEKRAVTEPLGLARATMHSRNEAYQEAFDDSVFGISMPATSSRVPKQPSGFASLPQQLSRESYATRDATPPMPAYAQSTTPSTRYTDSPFSHVPTPSSASSYSPAIAATSAPTPQPRQPTPSRVRSPVALKMSDRHDASRLGLPPVRESSTSSSNSTVKDLNSRTSPARKEVTRKTPSAPATTQRPNQSRIPSHNKPPSKTPQPSPTAKPQPRIPPELAHLNVDPIVPAIQKPLPPLRPSREGAVSLTDMKRPSPVVQSDLPKLYTTYHKRTPSQETPISPPAPSPSLRSCFGLSSRSSSRQESPRIDSAISSPPTAGQFARGPTPEITQTEIRRLQRTDSPAVGSAPSPSKPSRFGIFSRKPKVDKSKTTEKPKRQPKKGPAAGTGHEGYGRFGFRGRSGSTISSAGFRSPSADSNVSTARRPTASRKGSFGSSKDGSELDDFLKERLTPMVLRGSGSTFSATASTGDTQLASLHDPSSSSSLDSCPKPQLLPSAMQGDGGMSPTKRPFLGRRLPSDSSEDDLATRYPTLAARRSYNRLSQADGKSPVRMPAPINTSCPPQASSIDSYDAEISAWPQTDSTLPVVEQPVEDMEGFWLQPQLSETKDKSSRKWNFFQRAHAVPRPKGKQRAVIEDDARDRLPHPKVAHYAMMDLVEPVDLYEVEQIVEESETSFEDSASDIQSPNLVVPYERRHTGLLPSPPKAKAGEDFGYRAKTTPPSIMVRQDSSESPELMRAQTALPQQTPHVVDIPRSLATNLTDTDKPHKPAPGDLSDTSAFNTPEMPQVAFDALDKSDSPRQPRLSPVGRIPMVVSKRDRNRKLPDTSFSRPFARAQPHPSVKPPGALYTQIRASRELTSPIDSGSQPVSSTSTRSDTALGAANSSVNTNTSTASTNRTSMDVHAENDFIAFSPRKNSDVSYSNSSGTTSWMATLAPQPPQEEDPWAEYNDLLDDMLPQKTPVSAESSLGIPFQYSSFLFNPASPSVPTPLNFSPPPSTELPPPPRSHTVPAVLRVSQQGSLTPRTTISDLVGHYGNQSTGSTSQFNRTSLPNARASMSSSRYSRASGHSRSASLPEANARISRSSLTSSVRFNRDTQMFDIAEQDDSEQASNRANLRFGALMTSKWLSFGRVLVSPADNEMRLADEPRVLVLDGLGSDWSYYIAQTYPAAAVYSLRPTMVNGAMGNDQKPPPNHRQIPHSNLSAAFPFPKGFFTAVVFRFPIATTDSMYHACIFECKRVLRPGGYLEIAALDLDLVNMGARARCLVRGLKTRMQQQDPNVSLRNLSDSLVRLIGRRGFEDVQRCVVGVPVAGRILRSRDISSCSSDGSDSRPGVLHGKRRDSDKEFSFADLLQDARNSQIEPSKGSDEDITRMVAKVGRWWYSACYETPLLETDKSIWDDHALLRECQKQGTSFRLLICHAQKPTQTRRRTVSV